MAWLAQTTSTVLVPMMAEIAEAALDYGVELTPSQMAGEANKRLETIHRRQLQGLKGEQLLRYLGVERLGSGGVRQTGFDRRQGGAMYDRLRELLEHKRFKGGFGAEVERPRLR